MTAPLLWGVPHRSRAQPPPVPRATSTTARAARAAAVRAAADAFIAGFACPDAQLRLLAAAAADAMPVRVPMQRSTLLCRVLSVAPPGAHLMLHTLKIVWMNR